MFEEYYSVSSKHFCSHLYIILLKVGMDSQAVRPSLAAKHLLAIVNNLAVFIENLLFDEQHRRKRGDG